MKISKKAIIVLVISLGAVSASIGTFFIINYFISTEKSLDSKIQELMA